MSRIYQYPVVTEIGSDDYLALGSATNGSRAILASDLAPVIGNKTITERGTYEASGDNMDGYGQVTVDIPYTDIHVASGDIATFEGEDLPLKSLKVAVTPYQDLHGYDGPWAGGAGKNKLNAVDGEKTSLGVTFVSENGIITANGTSTGNAYISICGEDGIDLKANTSYVLSGCPTGGSNTAYQLDLRLTNGIGTTYKGVVDRGDGITFTTDEAVKVYPMALVRNGYVASNLVFKPMIRLATETDATFAPYSNICPISGWSEANVSVTGVNVWDEEWEVGGLFANTVNSKNYIPVVPNKEYCFVYNGNISNVNTINGIFYDANYQKLNGYISSGSLITYLSGTPKVGVFTAPSEARYFKFRMQAQYGTTYNNDISINYPSTDTSYHAYNGATYTIDLDGTRYGGTLDATNGTMTVDRVYVDMGTLDWTKASSGRHNTTISDGKYALTNDEVAYGISNQYKVVSASTISNNDSTFCYGVNGRAILQVNDSRYNGEDATAFKAHMSGVQLIYELATPITVQLSPTQVKSLVGTNNIFADCGAVDVEYQTVWVRPSN